MLSELEPLENDPPEIILSQRPAILVYVDGEPELREVEGTKYERVVNTRPLLVRGKRGRMFLHVFDGWMTAEEIDGEWSVDTSPPGALAEVLEKAMETRQVDLLTGQTSADDPPPTLTEETAPAIYVETSPAEFIVIDGAPRWVPIPETELLFVENTSYYAVENAIWFHASSLQGPWAVATVVPPVVYTIPPSSPLHYVTHVKVYGPSGDIVYVGYTPGYEGTYVDPATNVAVYGTGYYYTPWIGSVWYGPPVTYGFGVSIRYTPWTGWAVGFGFGWTWGNATVSVGGAGERIRGGVRGAGAGLTARLSTPCMRRGTGPPPARAARRHGGPAGPSGARARLSATPRAHSRMRECRASSATIRRAQAGRSATTPTAGRRRA